MEDVFDPAQLRTFLAVAQTLSFTQAAHRLGVRQSTVSQHVRRLEEAAGRQLFSRDTHGVELTEDGEAMLGFARSILEANERASSWFRGTRLRGRLRFGASEDFVVTRLPEILKGFRRDHPEVDLELTVELSGTLHQRLEAGKLDGCRSFEGVWHECDLRVRDPARLRRVSYARSYGADADQRVS